MFTGSIVAIVTPMDEKGNVCRASLKKLLIIMSPAVLRRSFLLAPLASPLP